MSLKFHFALVPRLFNVGCLVGDYIPESFSGLQCLNPFFQKVFFSKKLPGNKEVREVFQVMNRKIIKAKLLFHFSSLLENIQTTQITPHFVMLSFQVIHEEQERS